MRKNQLLFTGLFMLMSSLAYAQVNVARYELGIAVSNFVYQGDLTPSAMGSYRTMRFGVSLHASKIMNASFSLSTHLAIGGLRGDDAKYNSPEYRQQRNFNFRTPVVELSQQIAWNPLARNYADKGVSPYLFAGAGLNLLRIRRDYIRYNPEYFNALGEDVTARLARDAEHRVPRIIPVIPAGLGIRYNFTSRWTVNAEGAYRVVFTDYLDGFSKAANPSRNDHYHTLSIGAVYRIGKKNTLDCPVVKY